MKKSKNNKKHILLRYVNIIICVLIFSAMIVGTLGRTIIWQGKRWNAKADSLLTNTAEIIPHRGTLYADDGTVLATSLNLFEARLDFRNEGTNLDTLAKYLPALCDSLAVFDRGRSDRTSDEWKKRFLEEMNKDFSKRNDHA